MYSWRYIPICIRLISKNDTHSYSGINLILQDNQGNVVVDYSLTINHIPVTQLKNNFTIYVTLSQLIDQVNVNWLTAEYSYDIPIVSKAGDVLYDFLHYFELHGFKLLPNDLIQNNNLNSINLLGLRLKNPLYSVVGLKNYNQIEFNHHGSKLEEINLESFPFNFTNPLLFSSFQSSGHLNYVINDKLSSVAYLSDIKYLENMVGSVVFKSNLSQSFGLLMGNLKKLNGDGDLLLILSWSRILSLIVHKFRNKLLLSSINLNKTLAVETVSNQSVLPITISNDSSGYWGSCIYYNSSTLITNTHVVQPLIDDPKRHSAIIHLPLNNLIKLSADDVLKTPFQNLDLTFITLSTRNMNRVRKLIKPISFPSKHSQIGDKVNTIGYGLFFNPRSVTPIQSSGTLLTQYSLPYFPESDPKPVISITSSSCWNGSSGGGLFNSNDELIGIICSNATVRLPDFKEDGQIINGELEKLLKFCLALPTELIKEAYKFIDNEIPENLNDKIDTIWNLQSYHNDVMVNERDYKL